MDKKSQEKQILDYLKAGNKITPLEALTMFGCFRLSGRILDIRKKGIPVKTTIIEVGKDGKRVAEYSLIES